MIEVEELTKRYGDKRALNAISFEVPQNQVLGFIGPNGAGKTTTMKILTCYIAPTSGSAKVAGLDVGRSSLEVRQRIGYLPEDTPLYHEMTVLEFLRFTATLRRVEKSRLDGRTRAVAEVCGLFEVMAEPVGQLSKGYRQRVGLAQAMIHDPPILILDEPTSGLDPNQIVEIRELIKAAGQEKTVILSSHILPIVEATCSRVILIHRGSLVADGSIDEVIQAHGRTSLAVRIDGDAEEIVDRLSGVDGVSGCAPSEEEGEYRLQIDGDGDAVAREVHACVRDNGWPMARLEQRSASLEDVFRKLTRDPA